MSLPGNVLLCRSIILQNEDRTTVGKHVLFTTAQRGSLASETTPPLVGRVEEILVDPVSHRIIGMLLTRCDIGEPVLPYRMPSCRATTDQKFVVFDVSFFTYLGWRLA